MHELNHLSDTSFQYPPDQAYEIARIRFPISEVPAFVD